MEYQFGDTTIACTNTDRVVFPDDGITKGDVIAYYRDVADVMLPELRRRPLSVVRFTKGIAERGFFQKHRQKHYPAWIESIELGWKTRVDYPLCDSPAALVYFANQGALEFHVWTSRAETPERPDLLVFDLDPPEGRFDLVRTTALLVRQLFEELGLPAFVKTTGSKGLHVCAPLDGAAAYDEVMAFTGRVAKLLCTRHPDLVTVEFYKKDRGGRLFLDTMRNTPGATIATAYSLRGRTGAPLSAPITWAEVEDDALAPNGFRLRELRARLDRIGDPWAELRRELGSVASAAGKLARYLDGS